jgi:hypothetical protein
VNCNTIAMRYAPVSPWNYAVTMIEMFKGARSLVTGSGLFWQHKGSIYVVSAWHVLAAMNSEQFLRGNTNGHVIPDRMYFHALRRTDDPRDIAIIQVAVLDTAGEALWLQHPTLGKIVDIAAFKIPENLVSSDVDIRPANTLERADEVELRIAQEAFMIGWTGPERCPPTWKRGTISVEPSMSRNQSSVPVICVDCAAPAGFSGAPWIATDGGVPGAAKSDRIIGVASASDDAADVLQIVPRGHIEEVVAGACNARLR